MFGYYIYPVISGVFFFHCSSFYFIFNLLFCCLLLQSMLWLNSPSFCFRAALQGQLVLYLCPLVLKTKGPVSLRSTLDKSALQREHPWKINELRFHAAVAGNADICRYFALIFTADSFFSVWIEDCQTVIIQVLLCYQGDWLQTAGKESILNSISVWFYMVQQCPVAFPLGSLLNMKWGWLRRHLNVYCLLCGGHYGVSNGKIIELFQALLSTDLPGQVRICRCHEQAGLFAASVGNGWTLQKNLLLPEFPKSSLNSRAVNKRINLKINCGETSDSCTYDLS